MSKSPLGTDLRRHGLTIGQLLGCDATNGRSTIVGSAEFTCCMLNSVNLSLAEKPSVPTAKGRTELIRVTVRDDLLTIADIWGERCKEDGSLVERIGAKLYGRRTVIMDGATCFMLLEELPAGLADDKFFPAQGTAVLFEDQAKGSRMLKVCGVDRNSGASQGWMFHAIDV